MDRQVVIGVLLAVVVTTASGCLIVSGKSVDESGTKISSETMRQIEVGKTTEAWLVATLGEPDCRTVVKGHDDVAILRYDHCVTKAEGGAVFLIFAGGSETTTRTTTYFEVIDGIVTRTWVERG
jgi:hypothetical protein